MSEKKKRKKKGKRAIPRPLPFYPLPEVKALITEGKVRINGNALRRAQEDFNWGSKDILDTLLRLEVSKHFRKPEASKSRHLGVIDVYKVWNVKGEDVYTHFYIDYEEDCLVVNSFHRLTQGEGNEVY